MQMYPEWWQQDKQQAWERACERVKPCTATVNTWRRDEGYEVWLRLTGAEGPGDPRIDASIEREERARGGMWHRERQEPEYTRLRQAFEDAQREVQAEREAERVRRRQMAELLRIRRQAQRMKEEAAKPAAATDTIEREPTPCVEIEAPAFFGR